MRAAQAVHVAIVALVVIAACLAVGFVSPAALIAVAVILAGGLLVFLLPVTWVVVAWGALLPIWSVATLPPAIFDGARVALAAVIVIRLWGSATASSRQLLARWAAPIAAAGALVGLVGYARADEPAITLGTTTVLAVLVGAAVVTRVLDDPWPLLKGFLLGTCASATVLILTALGSTALSPQDDPGLGRYTGLAPAATRVTYELAIAVVIAVVAVAGRHRYRPLLLAAAGVSGAALLVSGGRGGLVALAVAGLLALRWRWLKLLPSALLFAAVGLAVSQLAGAGVAVNTLDRFLSSDPGGASLSLARVEVFGFALDEIWLHPVGGVGMETFVARHSILPHVAPLTFAIAGGLAAGLIIVWLLVQMVAAVLRAPVRDVPAVRVAYLLVAVLLVMSAVEPSGPFVGVETVTLLLVAAGLVLGDRLGVGAEEVDRGVRPVVRRVVVVAAGREHLRERR